MEAPLPTNVPPQLPENHSTTAPVPNEPPTAVRVVDVPLQTVVVPEIDVGATEAALTVTVTGTRGDSVQPAPFHEIKTWPCVALKLAVVEVAVLPG